MMKKLLFSLLFALVLVSCSKDDALPLPEISKVEITGTPDGKMEVTTGTAVTFALECKNVDIVRYEWIVNEKTESDKATFTFAPAKRGSYAISVKTYNADGGVTTKEIGTLKVVDPAPVVESLTCNGKPVADHAVDLSVGTAAKLVVTISNVEIGSYVWTLNGQTVESATGAELPLPAQDASGDQAVTVTAVNLDGLTVKDSVMVRFNGLYKTGFWVYGSTSGGLGFFDPAIGTFYEDNLYLTVNGEGTGSTNGINDLSIYNNKLYILIPENESKRSAVIACDAQTLKKEKVITAEGFDPASLKSSKEIYNLQVINENKFYVLYNSSNEGNKTGVGVLKVQKDGNNTFTTIDATYGSCGVDGPGYSHMVKNGGDVLIGCGSRVQVLNAETDQLKTTIDVGTGRIVSDIVKGRDGKLYAIVTGIYKSPGGGFPNGPTTTASVFAIDPATYAATEQKMTIDSKNVAIGAGLYGCMSCASMTSDEIFIKSEGFMAYDIYKFNYKTGQTSVFATTKMMLGKFMSASPDGLLYVPTTDWTSVYTSVYRISDGTEATDIEARIKQVKGDGGIISTYQFTE